MSQEKDTSRPTGKYTLYFCISLAAMLLMAFASPYPEWSWVTMPFVGTAFVMMMDWM